MDSLPIPPDIKHWGAMLFVAVTLTPLYLVFVWHVRLADPWMLSDVFSTILQYFKTDSQDFYKSKVSYILNNDISSMELTFSEEVYSAQGHLDQVRSAVWRLPLCLCKATQMPAWMHSVCACACTWHHRSNMWMLNWKPNFHVIEKHCDTSSW